MSEHGHDLAVDKANLWKVGEVDLPQVAQQYETAWDNLPYYPSNFYRSGGLGAGSPTEGAADAWGKLATALNDILWSTRTNLIDTGTALKKQATDYDQVDSAAQTEFQQRIKDMGTVH